MSILDSIHTIIFSGSLAKGGTWGGPQCTDFVPFHVHMIETIVWCVLCVVLYKLLNLSNVISHIDSQHQLNYSTHKLKKSNENLQVGDKTSKSVSSLFFQIGDAILLTILSTIWLQVLYYKINLKSLVNLLQPCHLSVLGQALAIGISRSSWSPILGFVTLPLTIGAIGAIIVPATEGLDQPFEEISFFIQHYILLCTPLYLLVRKNFNMLKIATFSSVLFSNWCVLLLHWGLFSTFDRYFQVNVNFFLCPSEGIGEMLSTLPPYLVQPSYRTLLSLVSFVIAIPICYLYIGAASIIQWIMISLGLASRDNHDLKVKKSL